MLVQKWARESVQMWVMRLEQLWDSGLDPWLAPVLASAWEPQLGPLLVQGLELESEPPSVTQWVQVLLV
jgi:hypothetical protein